MNMVHTEIRDFLFLIMGICLVFNNIPDIVQLKFLGSGIGNNLVAYPILFGAIYTIYCHLKSGNVLVEYKRFLLYGGVYLCILFISLIVGLIHYPYYDAIVSVPIEQMGKMATIIIFCEKIGITIEGKAIALLWGIFRFGGIVLKFIMTFGVSYMIFCWYHDDWKRGFNFFTKGILCSLIFVIGYSVFEIQYLAGGEFGKQFLEQINPYIHVIKVEHDWWPPLLWPDKQLRSVFPEPSHMGNYAAILLPVLWFYLLNDSRDKRFKFVLGTGYSLFIFMIFLTQARTAYAMFLGITMLMVAGLLMLDWRRYFKIVIMILSISLGIFFLSVRFINYMDNIGISKEIIELPKISAVEVVDKNLGSLAGEDKRSNGSRYALLKAHFRMGMESPLLGKGTYLNDSYTKDYFEFAEKENPGVKMWIGNQNKFGTLKYPIGAMNEYVERFSANGLLGLSAFLFPFGWILYKLIWLIKKKKCREYVCLLIAVIAALVVGANDSLSVVYGLWLLLGLSYAVVLGQGSDG